MKTTIGPYDPDLRNVPVRFEHAGVTHDRLVNACFDNDGAYDAAATAARVEDVGHGVTAKIDAGVIANAPADLEPLDVE
jgi:hypothetical protein